MIFIGIDCGTQGVRCTAVDDRGDTLSEASMPFERLNVSETEGLYEQRPEDWKNAMFAAVARVTGSVRDAGRSPDEIVSISIDGTSGTVLALDENNVPLTNGIMYNDPRAGSEAVRAHEAMGDHERGMGLRFNSSFSLPRLMWIREKLPDVYKRTARLVHQADYLMGSLTDEYALSDYSNALKTGYDLKNGRWPQKIESQLGIDIDKLPRVIAPGQGGLRVTDSARRELGLGRDTRVVGGSTDGYASAISVGAVKTGRWASIIGTTFVLKGVTRELMADPSGSSYSHMLPSGEWLLGGASNLGGRILNREAQGRSFSELDADSQALIPTGVRCYPLIGRGERFPFVKPDAEPFYIGDISGERLWPALMEGVAFAERYAFERMEATGCSVDDTVYTTGGACRSPLWLRIRASVLKRRLMVPESVGASVGSAILAASTYMDSLSEAAERMIRFRSAVAPDQGLSESYDEIYARFTDDLRLIYGI